MTKLEIIRAWKDEEYLSSLGETERVLLPQNPAGFVELSDDDLGGANGGRPDDVRVLGSCYGCTGNTITFGEITASTVSPP